MHHWWPMYSVSWPWYLRRLDPIPSPRPALIFMAHAGRKFVSVHESVESVLTLNTYFRFRFRPKILSFTFRFRAESESSFSAPFSFLAENVKPVFGRSLLCTLWEHRVDFSRDSRIAYPAEIYQVISFQCRKPPIEEWYLRPFPQLNLQWRLPLPHSDYNAFVLIVVSSRFSAKIGRFYTLLNDTRGEIQSILHGEVGSIQTQLHFTYRSL